MDAIITRLQQLPASFKVADFGCGDAELAATVTQPVSSFDLVATTPGTIACNMAHVPLGKDASHDEIQKYYKVTSKAHIEVQETLIAPRLFTWIAQDFLLPAGMRWYICTLKMPTLLASSRHTSKTFILAGHRIASDIVVGSEVTPGRHV